jgi:hypothetical protein
MGSTLALAARLHSTHCGSSGAEVVALTADTQPPRPWRQEVDRLRGATTGIAQRALSRA